MDIWSVMLHTAMFYTLAGWLCIDCRYKGCTKRLIICLGSVHNQYIGICYTHNYDHTVEVTTQNSNCIQWHLMTQPWPLHVHHCHTVLCVHTHTHAHTYVYTHTPPPPPWYTLSIKNIGRDLGEWALGRRYRLRAVYEGSPFSSVLHNILPDG